MLYDTADYFPRYQGKGYPVPVADEYEERDIPTNRLVATQSSTLRSGTTSTGPISVTHRKGWYYVGDGHHRAIEAIRRGDLTIPARIYRSK